jgi:hypothetical protein
MKLSNHRISRRRFLLDSGLVLIGAWLPGALLPGGFSVAEASRAKRVRRMAPGPLVADHTVVDRYVDIPQAYIDEVKKMWLNVPGESHSSGYRYGVQLLEDLDPTYAVSVVESGAPEGPTDEHLRVNGAVRNQYNNWSWGAGEQTYWTTSWAVDRIKNHIAYCSDTADNPIAAIGFGWCWDMTSPGLEGPADPVYGCQWGGRSSYWTGSGWDDYGAWGLDDGDVALLGAPRVSLQTYLDAVDEIGTQDPDTISFFTTGPVDGGGNTGELGYQRWLKHEAIRAHVAADPNRVLFDYGDILCWNDAGERHEVSWDGHTFQAIHSDNSGSYGSSHIGEAGCLRLGKALWWMLARIAGWEPEGPAAPTDLIATPVSFMQVDLAWTASADPDTVDYVIYRDGVQIDTCSGTSYSDMGVGPSRQYTYTVASRDGVGQVGSPCGPASAETPAAPYNAYVPLVVSE